MLNDVWTSLVNEVDATKKHYEELEVAMMMTNNHLNDGISTLDARMNKGEDKLSLGANPYLPPRYVLGSLWVLNQNTQHGPTRSI